MELIERANNYAEKNVIEVLKEAFTKVYADGYRDGYKDCEEKIPTDLSLKKTVFVDLDLPSGTLWASDYEKDGDDNMYLPYELAENYGIPTKQQWDELKKYGRWKYQIDNLFGSLETIKCVGPNGNSILFHPTGMKEFANKLLPDMVLFWIANMPENAVRLWRYRSENYEIVEGGRTDSKLPIRLVQSK